MTSVANIGRSRLDDQVALIGTDGVIAEISGRVAQGETLREIAASDGIPYFVLWQFLKYDPERMVAYKEAKEAAADAMAGEILGIADTSEHVRDKIDARKWLASKWGRKEYGEKVESDRGSGITVVVQQYRDDAELGVVIDG